MNALKHIASILEKGGGKSNIRFTGFSLSLIHIYPEDRLSDDELTDIAAEYMEGMGWGGQPYVVYKHTDIDLSLLHI